MGTVQSYAQQGAQQYGKVGRITGGVTGGISGFAVGAAIGLGIACFTGVGVVGIAALSANGIVTTGLVGTISLATCPAIISGALTGTAVGTSAVIGGVGLGAGIVGGCGVAGVIGSSFAVGGVLTGVGAAVVGGSALIGTAVGSKIGYITGGAVCEVIYVVQRQVVHYFRKSGEFVQMLVQFIFQQKQKPLQLKIPEWKPIKMTLEQFDEIKALTNDKFIKMVQKHELICSLSRQIMRQPYQMKCCKKSGEKAYLQYEVNKHKQCPFCKKPAQISDMEFDQEKDTFILGIRQKILKTYLRLNDQLKSVWKPVIDQHFGKSYIEKHIKNWKPQKKNEGNQKKDI